MYITTKWKLVWYVIINFKFKVLMIDKIHILYQYDNIEYSNSFLKNLIIVIIKRKQPHLVLILIDFNSAFNMGTR